MLSCPPPSTNLYLPFSLYVHCSARFTFLNWKRWDDIRVSPIHLWIRAHSCLFVNHNDLIHGAVPCQLFAADQLIGNAQPHHASLSCKWIIEPTLFDWSIFSEVSCQMESGAVNIRSPLQRQLHAKDTQQLALSRLLLLQSSDWKTLSRVSLRNRTDQRDCHA